MPFRIFSLCFLFTCTTLFCRAQEPDPENMYSVIARQITQLFKARGLPDKEIDEQIREFKDHGILTDQQLASLLQKLFPSNAGIGVLLYFFQRDSLTRIFMTPGAVIEKKIIALKKQELPELGNALSRALQIGKESSARSPRLRGAIVTAEKAPAGMSYPEVIKKATALLLPESFDEKIRHLLVVPALNIGTLPFSLLQPYKDKSLLVEKCSFTIVPSLLDLVGMRAKLIKNGGGQADMNYPFNENVNRALREKNLQLKNALFISNPAYPVNTDYIFPDLPGARKETEVARQFAQSYKLFSGKNAVKDSVFKYIRDADIAYFATHGISSEENPMEKSFLVLSGNDPFLTAKNIMDFRKTGWDGFPEMVILSACQTGLGKAMEAGIAGLARSFLLSGTNHVVMSLWNVDDQATAYLMNRFIFHLQEKGPFMPAEPLRKAMLDTRKKFPHPSRWASFSHFGMDY